MTRSARIGLIVVLVAAVVGAGGYYAWQANPRGPDRTEAIRESLVKAGANPDDVEIVKYKHVRSHMLDRIREEMPTLEVIDCTFRLKDSAGHLLTNNWQFWLVEGKVIRDFGAPFRELYPNEDRNSEMRLRYQIAQKTNPREARRIREEMTEEAGVTPGGVGGPPWAQAKAKGKDKDKGKDREKGKNQDEGKDRDKADEKAGKDRS